MTLIAILSALILERLVGGAYAIHRFAWLGAWVGKVERRLPANTPAALAYGFVLVPLLGLVGLVYWLVGNSFWGLSSLALDVLVLSVCLGPYLLDEDIENYLQVRGRYNEGQAEREELAGAVYRLTHNTLPASLSAELRDVTEGIFYQAHHRWYGVIFWYLLAGPLGAAVYRLTLLLHTQAGPSGDFAARVYGAMGWLPARISAVYFGIMGSLDEAFYALKREGRRRGSWQEGNRRLLGHSGCAAMCLEIPASKSDGQGLTWASAEHWVRRARALSLRALMLWLATVAVFTLLGWMV